MNKTRILKLTKEINVPEANVHFETENKSLQNLFHNAEELALKNIRRFPPKLDVLVESKGYSWLYLETQPMGGEMYAKRIIKIKPNQVIKF